MTTASVLVLVFTLLAAAVVGVVVENSFLNQQNNNSAATTPEATSTPTVSPQPTPSVTSPNTTNATTVQNPREIFATVDILSPDYTMSSPGLTELTVNMEYYTFNHSNGPVPIPYQNFKCIYQVDGDEWKEAVQVGDFSQSWVMSLVNNGGWTEIFCNYSLPLQGLSNGLHLVNVTVIPSDVVWCHDSDIGSSDTSIFLTVQDQRVFCYRLLMPDNSTGGNPHILDYMETAVNAPVSWMTYSLDGQANATLTKETKMPAVSDGCHYITVYAADAFGTVARSNTVWFSVES